MLSDKLFGTMLGLEFREDAIVVAYFKSALSGIHLLASSTFPLKDFETITDELRDYITHNRENVSRIFVSIPDRWAITKFIEIPSMKGRGKEAISNLMRFEIERHIPFEIDEVAYDFMIIDERNMKYLMAFIVVQKEKLDFIKEFLEKLSLHPHAITTTSLAILNVIELNDVPKGGWQELIGITRKSDLLGKKGEANISLYAHGGNASIVIINDGISMNLKNIMYDQSGSFDTLIEKLARYLIEMQAELRVERFNKLILSGDLFSTMDLPPDVLKDRLEIGVEQTIHFSGRLQEAEINGMLSCVGACFSGLGLGTYKANLLPHKIEFQNRKIAPLTTKVLLILIFVLVTGVVVTDAVRQKKYLSRIEETLKNNEPDVKVIEDSLSEIDMLKKKSEFLKNISDNEITLEILAELARVMPKDAWVTNLNYKGIEIKDGKKQEGELVLSGFAASSSPLISLLEDSPYFEKVEFVGPIKKTKEKEQFKLSANIVTPKNQ